MEKEILSSYPSKHLNVISVIDNDFLIKTLEISLIKYGYMLLTFEKNLTLGTNH